ncbi:hypothetical protein [Caulobacter sp. UC70_42]|uniref:hypothetical protein n=1 Tax=Caulobacter sp. UC70_42 TaxID=3374551 RepID=UPI003757EFBF
MAATAAVTAQAISVFRPRLIAMLGMCCGFAVEECASPCKFMDVIVVREVSCWEQGKYVEQDAETTEFKNRAKPRLVDDIIRDKVDLAIELSEKTLNPALKRISSQAKFKAIKEKFGEDVRELPEVRFAPIVTGSSVIADEGMISEICSRHPSAIGLDMEVFGLYAAAERSVGKRPSVLAIKGVADFGHVAKDDFGQAMASTISAEVFKNLLPHLGIFD